MLNSLPPSSSIARNAPGPRFHALQYSTEDERDFLIWLTGPDRALLGPISTSKSTPPSWAIIFRSASLNRTGDNKFCTQ